MSTKTKGIDNKETKKVVLSEEKKEELRKFNIKDILSNNSKKLSGLLKSNKGTKKENLYKSEIFADMDDNEKKSYRRKIRSRVQSILESILSNKDNKENLKTLINEFNDFYLSVYRVNDYSINSLASENTNEQKKNIINSALIIIKKELKK